MEDKQIDKRQSTVEDIIKGLPFVVWFCGLFGYLFSMLTVSISVGKAGSVVAIVMLIPMAWATWVRLK